MARRSLTMVEGERTAGSRICSAAVVATEGDLQVCVECSDGFIDRRSLLPRNRRD